MDIIRFKSGLGNQMFQYALYRELQFRGRNVKASLGYYEKNPDKRAFSLTEVFPQIVLACIANEDFEAIDSAWKKVKQDVERLPEFLSDYKNRFFWVEENDFCYRPEVFKTSGCTFVGYWQTEKYFSDIRDILLDEFQFAPGEKKLTKWCNRLLEGKGFVSVHVRRGDYLKSPKVWGTLSESKYYQNAVQYIENHISAPKFVFFSDDIQWVKVKYNYKNAIYIEENMFDNYRPWYDMCLMSCCSHNIIANSSFSWWGAWLNRSEEKTVIAPQKWFFDGRSGKDICPDTWKRIDIE